MQLLQTGSTKRRTDGLLLLSLIVGIGLLWGIAHFDTFDPSFETNVAKAVRACQIRIQDQWDRPAETRYTDGRTSEVTSANDIYHVTIWEVVPETPRAAQPSYACEVHHSGRNWKVTQVVFTAPHIPPSSRNHA